MIMNFMVDHGKDDRKSSYYDARFEKPTNPSSSKSVFEDDRKPSYYDARFEKPINPSSNKSVFEDDRKPSYYDSRFEKPISLSSNKSVFEDDRNSSYYDARFEKPSMPPSNKSVFEDEHRMDGSRDGGTSRPRFAMEDWSARRNDVGNQGSVRDSAGRMRFSNDQAGSSYQSGYDPSYMKHASVNHMHPDERDELLKKIDQLKDQIIRSCDIAENPRQRLHNNKMMPTPMHTSSPSRTSHYAGNGYYSPNVSNSPQRHVPQSYYGDYNRRPLPSTHNFNDPSPRVREHENYRYPQFKSPESQYTRRNFDGNHVNERKAFPHELDCSCLNCYVDNWQIPSRDPHSASKNKRASHDHTVQIDRAPVIFDSLRGQSKKDSEINGLTRQSPVKKRVYKPIAGGAPFILCTNCFELLKLPQKAVRKGRTEHQVCCGTCSSVNVVRVENNGLVPIPAAANRALIEVVESSGTNVIHSNHAKHDTKESCSLDFDNSSCNFHLTDTESSNVISVDERLNLGGNNEKQDECVSSSSSSHLVHDQKMDISKTVNDSLPVPLPCSPLKNGQDYSSSDDYILGGNCKFKASSDKNTVEDVSSTASDDIGSKCEEGSQKESYCQGKVVEDRKISHENLEGNGSGETELDVTLSPEEDASMATEIDDSFVDYSNVSDTVFDMKRQKDLISSSSQSVEVKPNVFVNGQPLDDRIVQKAEELAGPIQPGNYWYDFQAGFWGVIGHPCLGIILPFIDQFSCPMAEHCSNGNTGIYVNGRELHDRDLDLLAKRGLPTTRNKYYVILFSGRVFEKYSGEELTSLGKLAPTVDRQKRGFGMQVPGFLRTTDK